MTAHMMRYTVKAEQAAHNEELLRALFAELREVQPAGLSYTAVKLDDGQTFIHLICHDDDAGPVPGGELQALRAFHTGLAERCDEAPVRTAIAMIDAFGASDAT